MKILIKITVLMLISYTTLSCSKNDPQPVPKFRLIKYTNDSNEYNITYNSDGKLNKYANAGNSNIAVVYNADGKIIQNGNTAYTYDGQGRIFKIIEGSNEATLVYNGQGLVVKETFHYTQSTTLNVTRNFEYNTDNQLHIITENNGTQYFRQTLTYDSHNNIAQVKTETSYDNGVTYGNPIINDSYTYDTKKNPFYEAFAKTGITNSNSFVQFYGFESVKLGEYVFFNLIYYSPNNLLTTPSKSYNYTYDENDYPISSEEVYLGSGVTIYHNFTYETY